MIVSLRMAGWAVLPLILIAGAAAIAEPGPGAEPEPAPGDTAEVFDPTAQPQPGYGQDHAEAGFHVFWPSGCAGVKEQVSARPTEYAQREWVYTCTHPDDLRHGVRVLRMQEASDEHGNPPHPRFVVGLVQDHLALFSVRVIRQRPLEFGGFQGVDVHGQEPDGAGEVWVRGLLLGTDVFILMAWNRAGGVFENPEIHRFFDSFRLL
jgi:hypothetical protein